MSRPWWFVVGVAGSLGAQSALGQDAQYWTVAYGTRAQLLGGVVIGSANDLGGTFYDPGSLALTSRDEFAVAGSAYQYSSLKYVNGAGPGRTLGSTSVVGLPSLFAGEIKIGGKDRLAYSFLTRQSLDIDIEGRDIPIDTAISAPNVSSATGTVRLHQHLGEYWGGITYSHPFNEHIGIGITPYVAVRNQNERAEANAEVVGVNGTGGIVLRDYDFSYTHWRLMAKIGVGFVYPHLRAGIVLTTPGLKLLGSGQVGRNATTINQGVQGNGPTSPLVADNFQQDLSATYHSPTAIGAGGSYLIGNGVGSTTIHVAGEWFSSVDAYSILSPLPFTPQTGGAALTGVVEQKLDAVTNGGIGVEHQFANTFAGYVSFRTDFSSLGPAQDNNALISRWDLYHFTGGVSWQFGRSDFVLGADVAFGSSTQQSGLTTTIRDTPVLPAGAKINYTSITLIAGFRLAAP